MSAQQVSANADQDLSDLRYRMRHSAAHVMAEAVMKLFPEAQIAIGPPTEDGFYYDFEVSRPFTPEDLEQIEALMPATIASDRPSRGETLSREHAAGPLRDRTLQDDPPPRGSHAVDLSMGGEPAALSRKTVRPIL